jgi:hypothetical protein
MQQKKQRTPSSGSARRRAKGANAEAADARSAEQVPTFEERIAAPDRANDDAIRTRAYYLFLERGARAGHELDDWLRAESEIRA